MNNNNIIPFVVTEFDEYRARLRDSYIAFAFFFLMVFILFILSGYSEKRLCLSYRGFGFCRGLFSRQYRFIS